MQHRSTVAYSTAKFGPAVTALEEAIRRGAFRRIPSPPPDTLKRMISAGRTAKGMPPPEPSGGLPICRSRNDPEPDPSAFGFQTTLSQPTIPFTVINQHLFPRIAALGAVAVAVGIFAFRSRLATEPTPTAQPPTVTAPESPSVSDAEDRSASDREEIAQLRAHNAKLVANVQSVAASNQVLSEALAQRRPAKPQSAAGLLAAMFKDGSDGETNAIAGAMQQLIKSQLEQQTEGKISRMKARLRLTSEQEQAIRESMNAATKKALAATQKMYSGEAMPDVVNDLSSPEESGIQPIDDLLTPEQRTEYQALQKEEFQNTARVAASAEMMQLQGSLGLTQEQQDKVFSALYQQSVDPVSGLEATQKTASINDPAAGLQQAFDKKVEALRPILTSEQLNTYRDLQEKQIQMIQALFPKGTAPVPPTPTTLQSP